MHLCGVLTSELGILWWGPGGRPGKKAEEDQGVQGVVRVCRTAEDEGDHVEHGPAGLQLRAEAVHVERRRGCPEALRAAIPVHRTVVFLCWWANVLCARRVVKGV